VRLAVAVSVDGGGGETDRGARFEAAVAEAEVVVGRLRVHFRSRPGVAPTAAEARRAAMADLLDRLVAGLAW
jgi:hypothetical protein